MNDKISRTLKGLRTVRGLSVAELSRAVGCNEATIRRLEGGGGNPTIGTLTRILDALSADDATRLDLIKP